MELLEPRSQGYPVENKTRMVNWYHKKRHSHYHKSLRGEIKFWFLDFPAFQFPTNFLCWSKQMKTTMVDPLWYKAEEMWEWIWNETLHDQHSPFSIVPFPSLFHSCHTPFSRGPQEDIWGDTFHKPLSLSDWFFFLQSAIEICCSLTHGSCWKLPPNSANQEPCHNHRCGIYSVTLKFTPLAQECLWSTWCYCGDSLWNWRPSSFLFCFFFFPNHITFNEDNHFCLTQ